MNRPGFRLPVVAGCALALLASAGCAVTLEGDGASTNQTTAPVALSSWNDGPVKATIVDFVDRVTREGGPDYVAPHNRVATFDNDGTLWAEKPLYFQFAFVYERIRALAPDNPGWANEEPFKTIIDSDATFPPGIVESDFLTLLVAGQTGTTQAEFAAQARSFLATARHPQLDRLYPELVYQPMLELLDYLRDHDFEVHIVSGGTVEFIRAYADRVYGVPPENVVGSSFAYEFRDTSAPPQFLRQPSLTVFNDSAAKPVNIQLHIGKRPILAFGNSNGDIEMLELATGGGGASLALLLHHDDAEREFAYDTGTERALTTAAQRGWTVVSMRDDFATLFPAQGR